MTPEQIILVQGSFAKVAPISEVAADLFYNRLFQLDPGVRALFKDDLARQKRALMTMLRVVVAGLYRPSEIIPGVQALGRRHSTCSVVDANYDTVGAALLWTLEQGLGEGFTPVVRDAWVAAYGLLSTTMRTPRTPADVVMSVNAATFAVASRAQCSVWATCEPRVRAITSRVLQAVMALSTVWSRRPSAKACSSSTDISPTKRRCRESERDRCSRPR
ncbi:MAG: globin family protein [Dehalococcoidia bacterium]